MYQISNNIPEQQQSLIPLSGVSDMEKKTTAYTVY